MTKKISRRQILKNGTSVALGTALAGMTRQGARALGLGSEIGTLEVRVDRFEFRRGGDSPARSNPPNCDASERSRGARSPPRRAATS